MLKNNINSVKRVVNSQSAIEAANFVQDLRANAVNSDGVFDSATANDFVAQAVNQNSIKVPKGLAKVFDEAGDESHKITKAILDGANAYETQHGVTVPADMLEYAMHMAYGTTGEAKRAIFDSASNDHADNLSLQPNRAVVAILSALGDAIPFAHYLPADINSNEARIAILSHQAGKQYGQYEKHGSLDGSNSGDIYLTSSRFNKSTVSGGAIPDGQLTSVQTDDETCAAAGGDIVGVNLLRGRTQVYVNGQIVARETSQNQSGTGNSSINSLGAFKIYGNSTEFTLTGQINTDTGAYTLTATPDLPDGTDVVVEGFIDYDRQPALVPTIITNADVYQLYAKSFRCTTQYSLEASTQMTNELGLDPYSESLVAIQAQFGNERHYDVLRKGLRLGLGQGNVSDFNFNWAIFGEQKMRYQVALDMQAHIGIISQQMAINTMAYGVSHLYVDKYMKAVFQAMPLEVFQPSGIQDRPGIFRLGRFLGMYDVYYTPKVLDSGTNEAGQILCVGRATDVTRSPVVLGDAVPPTIVPLAVGTDLKRGAGFYARNFTEINPHKPSSMGFGVLRYTGLGL